MKPMLLPREAPDLDKLSYPVYVTPKLDGIRCLIKDGVAYSRTLKPLPNNHIQEWAKTYAKQLNGMDGEIIVGNPTSSTVYRDTNSMVMSHDSDNYFEFYHFDYWNEDKPYRERTEGYLVNTPPRYRKLTPIKAVDADHILQIEHQFLELGYEGIIINNPDSFYKHGRCTVKESIAFKLKRFVDDEAVIIGFEEEMHNGNDAEINELGRTKRSTAKSGMSGKGSLGSFICKTNDGVEFNIGSGFTQQDRIDLWNDRQKYIGSFIKYKYFPVGIKEKPRHPVFLGFRDVIDFKE